MSTIGEIIRFYRPATPVNKVPWWPPDAFGLAAALLRRSGAYTAVIDEWPPKSFGGSDWVLFISEVGRKWKLSVGHKRCPKEVRGWWRVVYGGRELPLQDLEGQRELCEALLQILAAADEASVGVGLVLGDEEYDSYRLTADDVLWESITLGDGGSLCIEIPTDRARVLPKIHTPQSGITLRSLSHHLAFCPSNEVAPAWAAFPAIPPDEPHGFNLLLLPWPQRILPSSFHQVDRDRSPLRNMPNNFGFFEYRGGQPADWCEKLLDVFKRGWDEVGSIDGIVLPELALRPNDAELIYSGIAGLDPPYSSAKDNLVLIAGVGQPSEENGTLGRNYASLVAPLPVREGSDPICLQYIQEKHHRWRLDGPQIEQYGMSARLDPNRSWWELSSIRRREVWFVVLRRWLTACCLVCEDLARVDPVSETIRAVGPNLVIALLLDGPQLASRWPARYATVLADDPGCGVLTVTSLGMATLSRPPGLDTSRVVALWKDAVSGGSPVEIELPEGHQGVVLTLTQVHRPEWAADGRKDTRVASFVKLTGVRPVKIAESGT